MRARLIVAAAMIAVLAGLFGIMNRPERSAAGHQAGIVCQDGVVLVGAINYPNGGQYSIDGGSPVPFAGGFGPLTLSGSVQHRLVVTASDWPTFDNVAGPCQGSGTTTTTIVVTLPSSTTTVAASTTTSTAASTTVPGVVVTPPTSTERPVTNEAPTTPIPLATVPPTTEEEVQTPAPSAPIIPSLPVTL